MGAESFHHHNYYNQEPLIWRCCECGEKDGECKCPEYKVIWRAITDWFGEALWRIKQSVKAVWRILRHGDDLLEDWKND